VELAEVVLTEGFSFHLTKCDLLLLGEKGKNSEGREDRENARGE